MKGFGLGSISFAIFLGCVVGLIVIGLEDGFS